MTKNTPHAENADLVEIEIELTDETVKYIKTLAIAEIRDALTPCALTILDELPEDTCLTQLEAAIAKSVISSATERAVTAQLKRDSDES